MNKPFAFTSPSLICQREPMNFVKKLWSCKRVVKLNRRYHTLINESFYQVTLIWTSINCVCKFERENFDAILICSVKLILVIDKVLISLIPKKVFHKSHIIDFVEVDDLKELSFTWLVGLIFGFENEIFEANCPLFDLLNKLLLIDFPPLFIPNLK